MDQNTTTSTGAFLEPERIVRSFDLEKGDHVADFGAGHGFFTLAMARIVGGDGKVFAIDIQKSVLEVIRAKAKLEHLLNIEAIWADIEAPGGSGLRDRFIDFVLLSNILFQSEQRGELLREAYRILREGGRLAVIEWDEKPTPIGPPISLRVKKANVKVFAEELGFEFDREFDAGNYHYGLLFVKR